MFLKSPISKLILSDDKEPSCNKDWNPGAGSTRTTENGPSSGTNHEHVCTIPARRSEARSVLMIVPVVYELRVSRAIMISWRFILSTSTANEDPTRGAAGPVDCVGGVGLN